VKVVPGSARKRSTASASGVSNTAEEDANDRSCAAAAVAG
jgi:hypothetical protein